MVDNIISDEWSVAAATGAESPVFPAAGDESPVFPAAGDESLVSVPVGEHPTIATVGDEHKASLCQNITSNKTLTEPSSSCPLNFDVLYDLAMEAPPRLALVDVPSQCQYMQKGILFVRSEYLRIHRSFVPPVDTSHSCWELYRSLVAEFLHNFDVQATCGYHPEWVSETFRNITRREEFEKLFPVSEMNEMRVSCNKSLGIESVCQSCIHKLFILEKNYLKNRKFDNVSDPADYLFMYAAAFSSELGPSDPAIAKCLFTLEFSSPVPSDKKHKPVVSGVILGCIIGVLGASVSVWLFWVLHKKFGRQKKNFPALKDETSWDFGFGLHRRSASLVKFRIDEIRTATMNFSRNFIIGKGGFGNVYKGVLPDGSEVAFKRFKNCSASGDATFAHEVKIIASVRHVNLVALRGYCTATVNLEGHQRIIVCDLMRNGSLYDHLFGSPGKLSWPIRRKIALGTARGLAYLHYGIHPAIIHRDIKASNILLDETFEPKVADFGLAKFNSQGMTHLSTRVAGTLGYVAPEYALYGKLTEKSDVYSFGVVLLELLSGKKAYENDGEEVSLLTDRVWSLVKEGRAIDVIENDMLEMESPEMMEQYVHIAVICAHPLLQARPTMYQIVKILETNLQLVPSTLGDYFTSGYMSGSSITSDEQNSDRNTEESLKVTIV
ncbi:probable LRR receptor-like serine/threonine-protein kinase RKF3 [Mercurialis annua]|uniref:probable LRR receptor-like serine/threonine-protein kinase RKF3 n=1 Tax=Mercurialis annua TaxID=3986 RepID=UPI0021607BF3|nr:probable LRR receptor-like serine/threonine-protein kinase RKF3 [Mercurialis annua]